MPPQLADSWCAASFAVAYGVSRPARRVLALRALGGGAEHRPEAGDEHARVRAEVPNRLEQRRGRAGDRGQRLRRALPGVGHERRRGEVVELVGPDVRPTASRSALRVEQVAFDKLDPAPQMLGETQPAPALQAGSSR